jgi:hypothetical protein
MAQLSSDLFKGLVLDNIPEGVTTCLLCLFSVPIGMHGIEQPYFPLNRHMTTVHACGPLAASRVYASAKAVFDSLAAAIESRNVASAENAWNRLCTMEVRLF